MQFASVAIISVSFDDRFPQVGIQVTMIKTYNPDKTLIESTSETPYYPLMGGGGGGSNPSVHLFTRPWAHSGTLDPAQSALSPT